jgi:hypothetical protein
MPVGSELEKPGVKVFQEFVTLSPTLIRPTLQEVLIGIARQVEVQLIPPQ